MVHHCCVPKCSSTAKNSPGVSFHAFPISVELRKKWLHSVRRDAVKSLTNPNPFVIHNKHTKVCSKHFKAEDFLLGTARKKLASQAVPSEFAWTGQKVTNERQTRKLFCALPKLSQPVPEESYRATDDAAAAEDMPDPRFFVEVVENEDMKEETECAGGCKINTDLIIENVTLRDENKNLKDQLNKFKLELQAKSLSKSDKLLFSINILKSDDSLMAYYTGFPSYAVFMIAFELLIPYGSVGVIHRNIKSEKINRVKRKLATEDEFLLFLVKLRRAFGYQHLGFLFKISASSVCRIFTSWLSSSFRVASQQFTPEYVEECRKTAAERIHAERVVSPIKSFQILSGDLPMPLLESINQIWTVCCWLTSIRSTPLNKDSGTND